MTTKTKTTNRPRLLIQWIVILIIVILAVMPVFNEHFIPDFEAYCPFGGIQALGSFLLNQSLSCTMTSAQIVMGLVLILAVIVFSKLFCSYICPIGTISEWLGKLGDKLKIRITIHGIADKILRSLKYILLFITFYFTFQSNELFCKKFDPYFATASGFSMDVVVMYAVAAIVLVVLGSVFIRLFWCKYICPLGAVSNIFRLAFFFVAVLAVYVILLKSGVVISYVWPLAVACLGGYLIELTGKKLKVFPLFRITRNEQSCINCQLCSRKCPQAIDVASLKVVDHVDCTLCGECMEVCPVEDTVRINNNKRLKRLPVIAVLVLVMAGFLLGSFWELPTIDQKWYGEDEMTNAKIFSMEGLKNIKCYGSSMAFASKMKQVKGIMGVATYVKNHKVKIYYNPQVITEQDIQKQIFTPSKRTLKPLRTDAVQVKEATVWLEDFFDSYDFNYLTRLLVEKTNAVGLVSEYDCPVKVRIYFAANDEIDQKELIRILETESLTFDAGNAQQTIDLDYRVAKGPEWQTISLDDYKVQLFSPFVAQFNNYLQYDSIVVKMLKLPLGTNVKHAGQLQFLVSHLSNDHGVIGFRTSMDSLRQEMIGISYVDSLTSTDAIFGMLNSDSLSYTMRGGKKGKIKNVFHFDKE
jgi:polyferredoxin